MSSGTGTNRLIEKAQKADITILDASQFDFTADFALDIDGIVMKTSSHSFIASNPIGDKLFDLSCQWTSNCNAASRKAKKTRKALSATKNVTPVFRTLPVQACSFQVEKNAPASRDGSDASPMPTYTITTKIRISEGHTMHTLGEIIDLNQRISDKNIMKWASQLLEMVLTYHNSNVCMRQLTIDDITVASDKSVSMLFSRITSTNVKRAQSPSRSPPRKETPSKNKSRVSTASIIDEGSVISELDRIKTTRDMWYNPTNWFYKGLLDLQSVERSDNSLDTETRLAIVRNNSSSHKSRTMAAIHGFDSDVRGNSSHSHHPNHNNIPGDDCSTVTSFSSLVVDPPKHVVTSHDGPLLPQFFPVLSLCEKTKADVRIFL